MVKIQIPSCSLLTTLGASGVRSPTQLVVWSFLTSQGKLGNPPLPNQFLFESFGTESSGDPDLEDI